MLRIQTGGHEQRGCFFFNVGRMPSARLVYRILAWPSVTVFTWPSAIS
jgi:hypothetical protein